MSNEKQQNGVTTQSEEAAVVCFNALCYRSPGGSEENEQHLEQ
jgi:hypothetical protein